MTDSVPASAMPTEIVPERPHRLSLFVALFAVMSLIVAVLMMHDYYDAVVGTPLIYPLVQQANIIPTLLVAIVLLAIGTTIIASWRYNNRGIALYGAYLIISIMCLSALISLDLFGSDGVIHHDSIAVDGRQYMLSSESRGNFDEGYQTYLYLWECDANGIICEVVATTPIDRYFYAPDSLDLIDFTLEPNRVDDALQLQMVDGALVVEDWMGYTP